MCWHGFVGGFLNKAFAIMENNKAKEFAGILKQRRIYKVKPIRFKHNNKYKIQ